VLAWDQGARFAFRVDGTAVPAFHAWVKDYHFVADGTEGTLLRVAMGCKPRLAFKLAKPLLSHVLPHVLARGSKPGTWPLVLHPNRLTNSKLGHADERFDAK
jgi:hypothetical protein